MTIDTELETRARRTITRALDAVVLDRAVVRLADDRAGAPVRRDRARGPWAVAGVGALAAAAVAAVVLVPGSDDDAVIAGTDGSTTTAAAQEPPTSPPGSAAPGAESETSDDEVDRYCDAVAPPFTIGQLPEGIDPTVLAYPEWRASVTVDDDEGPPELADPAFVLVDPTDAGRRLEISNGSSWRLESAVRDEELSVLGARGWIADVSDGTAVIDFTVSDSTDGCAGWSIRGVGITEAELRATVSSLALG